MKRLNLLILLACFTLLFSLVAVSAHAAHSLSLATMDGQGNSKTVFAPGEDLYLHIMASDLQNLAGCTFTLNYDSSFLVPPATDTNGLPTDPTAIISLFPFTFVKSGHADSGAITSRENSSMADKILFAGASIDTTTGGAKFTTSTPGTPFPLFVVRFRVLSIATTGSYTFSLSQTNLNNTTAGYAAGGENLPLLLGAAPNTDTTNWNSLSGGAFSVLLASLPEEVNTTINIVPSGQTCVNAFVRTAGGSFNALHEAYKNAVNGDTIQSQAVSFSENLDFSQNISVALKGGYDCSFSTNDQKSTVDGTVTISNGTVTMDNIIIR
ncbi:MAG: hypothetical protein ACOYOS_08250 [Syntrophales bacterium]